MKINITGIRGIPAQHGGFETFAESLSIYLSDRNWNVTVYCQTSGCGLAFVDSWNHVRRVNIPIPFNGPLSTIIFDLLSTLHICFFSKAPTLILGYNTAIFSFFYRLFGIPTIMNMDGIEWKRDKWSRIAKIWFKINEWLGCRLSDHLVSDHLEIKNHLTSRHGPLSITTIPYGAHEITSANLSYLFPYNLEPNGYYLVIARPEPENSIKEIVTAFVESTSTKKLVLLGNYSQIVNYQAQILQVADSRVLFPGAIYDHNIVDALRYYCFSYIHGHTVGGTNPSLVEAMGAGCAVIARNNLFNKGVCADSAFYFQNSKELKNIINSLTDDSIIEIRKKSHRRFKENYTLNSILIQYENLLCRIFMDKKISI